MAFVFLKPGKGKLELAATDTSLHSFPYKMVSLGQDRHILFQSILYSFALYLGSINRLLLF